MKSPFRHLLIGLLVMFAAGGAQGQSDEVLERYDLALTNLSESLALVDSEPATSRDELDRAAAALRFMADEAGSPGLIEAMERVFERARTAIANRSATDLAVQAAILRGGFQRALFESAMRRLASQEELARARLDRLMSDLDLGEQRRSLIQSAEEASRLRQRFVAAVAERVAEELGRALDLLSQSRDDSYRALAGAYGDFLLIQDSPLTAAELNARFGEAAESLVSEQGEEATETLQALAESFADISAAAQAEAEAGEAAGQEDGAADATQAEGGEAGAGQDSASPGPAAQSAVPADDSNAAGTEGDGAEAFEPIEVAAESEDGSESATGLPETGAGQQEAGEQEAPVAPAGQTGEQSSAGREMEEGVPAGIAAGAAQSDSTSPQALTGAESDGAGSTGDPGAGGGDGELLPEAGAAQAGSAALQALTEELMAAGIQAERATGLASGLLDNGQSSIVDVLDGLYATAGKLAAALQRGDRSTADAALSEFEASYRRTLQPILVLVSADADRRIQNLTAHIDQAPGTRPEDAAVLLGEVAAAGDLLVAGAETDAQAAQARTALYWMGWPRAATLLILALLAILPLYLLNLAFGGGNRNWQLVGVALFLLLLPLIYEALITLASVVADLAQLPGLAFVASYSIFAGPIGQVGWAIITAAAIILASSGLYGVCVQFGLLRGRRAGTDESQTLISQTAVPDGETVVDWDEEF